jgi:hypothetical protein
MSFRQQRDCKDFHYCGLRVPPVLVRIAGHEQIPSPGSEQCSKAGLFTCADSLASAAGASAMQADAYFPPPAMLSGLHCRFSVS